MSAHEESQLIYNGPTVSKRKISTQLFYSVSANLSLLNAGMALAFPTISLDILQDTTQSVYLTGSQGSWYSSVNMLTAPIGALICGCALDTIGRKYTLILLNSISIVSWTTIGFTTRSSSYLMFIQLMIARATIGLVNGLVNAPSVYTAEIGDPSIRGRLLALTPLSISIGSLTIYFIGIFLSTNFRLVGLIACVISIFSLTLSCIIPESPHWLVLRNKLERAKISLIRLNGLKHINDATSRELDKELDTILKHVTKTRSATTGQSESFLNIFLKETVYKPLILIMLVYVIQQFCGTSVMIVYAAQFARASGVLFNPFVCAVCFGITRVVGTALVSTVLDKCGRKPPIIISLAGMATCLFLLALLQWLHRQGNIWVAVLMVIYFFAATIGILTVPFAMVSELFPQIHRGLCVGLTTFEKYLLNFAVIKMYPSIEASWHISIIYVFFCVISILGALIMWLFLPETKGKTLAEIENGFISKSNRSIA